MIKAYIKNRELVIDQHVCPCNEDESHSNEHKTHRTIVESLDQVLKPSDISKLQNDSALVSITINIDVGLQEKLILEIIGVIKNQKELQSLKITGYVISFLGNMLSELANCLALKSLSLFCYFTKEQISQLIMLLQTKDSIEHLAIRLASSTYVVERLEEESKPLVKSFFKAMRANQNITSLRVDSFAGKTYFCKKLSKFLAANTHLVSLDMSTCYISQEEDIKILIHGLLANKTLHELHIELRRLSETSLSLIRDMLQHNHTLLEIHEKSIAGMSLNKKPYYKAMIFIIRGLLRYNQMAKKRIESIACRMLSYGRILLHGAPTDSNQIWLPAEVMAYILSYVDTNKFLTDKQKKAICSYALNMETLGQSKNTFFQAADASKVYMAHDKKPLPDANENSLCLIN